MSLGAAWALPLANTTEEAIDLLAHGSPEYRGKTGRKTLLRGCCLYMISDPELTCIFESATHHYGVRYPGDMGEAGNYVCASNNDWCAYSYDDEDKFNTTEPMTKFGHVSAAPASLVRVTVDGKKSNWYRFWTLMEWCQHNYLNIDIASIQAFSTSHFYCDKNGARSDYFHDPTTKEWVEAKSSGFSVCQHQPLPDDHARGTKDVTIYELSKDGVNIYQTWGRPCEWDGPWDEYTPFKT